MSLEKLAELLEVDEVSAMHGSKGASLAVRIGDSWLAATLSNDDLYKAENSHQGRSRLFAKRFSVLASTLRSWREDEVHKVHSATLPAAMPLPQYVEPIQFRRLDPMPPLSQEVAQRAQESFEQQRVPSKPLGSRFEAIIAELEKL